MNYPGKDITAGSTNKAAVIAIKKRLTLLGYGHLTDSPAFGPETLAAVKKFQHDKLLLDDGIVGPLTWKRLFEAVPPVADPVKSPASMLAELAIKTAETQLFVREKTGRNDGEAVERYLASVGLKAGFAWCAAFMYWCFDMAAKQIGVTNPLPRTAGVLDHWRLTSGEKVSKPQRGDVFVMEFQHGLGHMGIVQEVDGEYVHTIDGNTGLDSGRDGDGVYQRRRKISGMKGFIRY